MARIDTTYAERRIHERLRALSGEHAIVSADDDDPGRRARLLAGYTGEAEGLCFALGLLTGEDHESLFERLWIEGLLACPAT